MILDKTVEIRIGARNYPKIVKKYPAIKVGNLIGISQKECLEFSKTTTLECQCDSCNDSYIQSADRIIQNPLREKFCGKCMFLVGQENMKQTMKNEDFRKKRSEITKKFYKTEYGKEVAKEVGKKRSLLIKSRPDLIEKYTKHLKHPTGKDHPHWNPNKPEFQEYAYKVRLLTEKTYKENIDIINPFNYQRTLCGINGGYQLDHIISIKYGFETGLSPEELSDISNLQMLPWKDNRDKWH